MIEINETEEIMKKLSLEGKTRVLDTPEDIKAMIEMDENMKKVHEDYLAKSAGSIIRAKDCWVYQHTN
jgi:hypothetical protein